MKKLTTKNYFFTWEQPISIILVALFCFTLSGVFASTSNKTESLLWDKDNDEVADHEDNCVDTYNPSQADYDGDGIGDVCDDSHDCSGITSIRRVQNLSSSCSSSDISRVVWIQGAFCKEIGDLYFIEYDNGTAKMTGQLQEVDGGNISIVDVNFSGKTNNGTPYIGCVSSDDSANWYYYADFSGTIGGLNVIPNPDHNFQIGFGANVKNDTYGASGWFTLDGTGADFNFDFSEPLACASDADNDGIADTNDNCVNSANPVQAEYDGDGIGDVCDDSHDCTNISSIRRVKNLDAACSGSKDRVLWIQGDFYRETGDLYFIEFNNGTAELKGTLEALDGSDDKIIDVVFTNRTLGGTPYEGCTGIDQAADWYYYADFSGTIGGNHVVPNPDHNFQVGIGANAMNQNYGASGWMKIDGINADFNFELGASLTCNPDADNDGITDANDNCINTANPSQSDYDGDGIGDVCDDSHDCTDITSIKRVKNLSSSCSWANTPDRIIWIEGELYKEIGDLYFVEYSNGTANLNGSLQSVNGGTIFDVDVTFTDKSSDGNPYEGCASLADVGNWYYYLNYTGTIGGYPITQRAGHQFQIGNGANVKNDNYGASGWFTINGQNADFNFELGTALGTAGCCDAEITGFQIYDENNANGNTLFDFSETETYCEALFTSDIRIRALVDGTHESLKFTITGPNGLVLTNTENQVTYDSKKFWANPGTYTITAKLYKEADLGGTLCDEQTITLVIEETCGKNLGDKVFLDDNGNGIQENGEGGVEDVEIVLISAGADGVFHTADDVNVDTVETDADGKYLFTDLASGDYCVQFNKSTLPTGYIFTGQNLGGAAEDSDVDAAGKTGVITIINDDILTVDAGIKEVVLGSIGNKVWEDLNGNGIQDAGEPGVAGVFIFLQDEFGVDVPGVPYQYTDTSGFYTFNNLPLGKYIVKFATPSGLSVTLGNQGNDDTVDNDSSPLDGKSSVIMLTSTTPDVTDIDAGLVKPILVTGNTWVDDNEDGIENNGEVVLENVTVRLLRVGADQTPGTIDDEVVSTTTTDSTGVYAFYNVVAGKYFLNFDLSTAIGDYEFTQSDQGNDDLADSNVDPVTGNSTVFMVMSATNYIGIDGGVVEIASLPVKLVRFDAEKVNCFTELTWTTSEEIDFSHFELEYSSNRLNFALVEVISSNRDAGVQNYSAIHKNTAENNYYRLKMVDLDGSFEYSQIINIIHDCNAANGMSIFPNPVAQQIGEISIKFFSSEEFTNIHIIDGMGRIISTIPQEVTLDWNVKTVDVSNLSSGIYYIMIDGNRNASRFIIAE